MATPCIIPDDARQFIIDNCSLTGSKLKDLIWEKYGVDVSVQAIMEHVKKARQHAEEATKAADAHISQKIAERVEVKVVPLMEIMEREIMRIANALDGKDPHLRARPELDKDGEETGWVQSREYAMLTKELRENIKAYVALRPQIVTVKIDELDTDMEMAFLNSCSEEDIAKLEVMKHNFDEMQKLKAEAERDEIALPPELEQLTDPDQLMRHDDTDNETTCDEKL